MHPRSAHLNYYVQYHQTYFLLHQVEFQKNRAFKTGNFLFSYTEEFRILRRLSLGSGGGKGVVMKTWDKIYEIIMIPEFYYL